MGQARLGRWENLAAGVHTPSGALAGADSSLGAYARRFHPWWASNLTTASPLRAGPFWGGAHRVVGDATDFTNADGSIDWGSLLAAGGDAAAKILRALQPNPLINPLTGLPYATTGSGFSLGGLSPLLLIGGAVLVYALVAKK